MGKTPTFTRKRYIVAAADGQKELIYGIQDKEKILQVISSKSYDSFVEDPSCAIQFDDFAKAYSIASSYNKRLGTTWNDIYVKEITIKYYIGNKCEEPLDDEDIDLPTYILEIKEDE